MATQDNKQQDTVQPAFSGSDHFENALNELVRLLGRQAALDLAGPQKRPDNREVSENE